MRADLSYPVAQAIERCSSPTLIFDLDRIAANFSSLSEAARASQITTLFAMKSFPAPAVHFFANSFCAGFDVASPGEVAALASLFRPPRVVSIADPTARALDVTASRVIVSCDTPEHVASAPPRAEIAIRLSASLPQRDTAIGAVLDGSGHRRSRFGLDTDPTARRDHLVAMVRAAGDRRVGLHVHHGPVTATSADRFLATARAALAAAHDADLSPAFLNLGGAWHGLADLAGTFRALRAALPDLEIVVEPGRLLATGAGFAVGRIVAARTLDDRALRVTDLSRICHLRWSPVELVGPAPHAGTGERTLVVGPTCFEDDVLGEWTATPSHLPAGARLVLRGVTGYSLAWNTGFGGVPPAAVVYATDP